MRFIAFPVLIMQSLLFSIIGLVNCGWSNIFKAAKTSTQQISGNVMLLLTVGLIVCAFLLIRRPIHQLVPYILVLSVGELLALIFILGETASNAIGWVIYFLSLVLLVVGAFLSRKLESA